MSEIKKNAENIIPLILDLHPLVLEVGKNLSFHFSAIAKDIERLCQEMAVSLGLVIPIPKLMENLSLNGSDYLFKVRDVAVQKGEVRFSHPKQISNFLQKEFSIVVHQYAHEFLAGEQVEELLEHARRKNPKLVEAVYPSLLDLSEIQQILKALLKEGIPIRDLEKILEVLKVHAEISRDPEILTEYVRHALSRTIGSVFQDSFQIKAYLLDEKIEQWIAGSVRLRDGQIYMDMDPSTARQVLKKMRKKISSSRFWEKKQPVLLVSPEIRRFVKMMLERNFPNLPVLAYTEISSEYQVKFLGVIRLNSFSSFYRFFPFLNISKEIFPGDDLQKTILILNLLGHSASQVAQYFTPYEKESISIRSFIAPVPTQGKESVLDEFLGYLPKEKKVKTVEQLSHLATQDPHFLAGILQKHWLVNLGYSRLEAFSDFGESDAVGKNDTTLKEKSAIFITSAARWIQEEVYRFLQDDELRDLGISMLQFPFISPDGKRKAWDEYEGILYKDEWWDPETLARFVRASLNGKIDEFKKRGFKPIQKLAVLLLSLPQSVSEKIGKKLLGRLTRPDLHQLLSEMGQWRDYMPPEPKLAALDEFLNFANFRVPSDFSFSDRLLEPEVNRLLHRDFSGALGMIRLLWLSSLNSKGIFERVSMESPERTAFYLYGFLKSTEMERSFSPAKRFSFFVNSISPEFREKIQSSLHGKEKEILRKTTPPDWARKKVLNEFLRTYYGGNHPTPVPFLRKN
jgi:flagellar motor switch protein FliG